MTLDSRLLLIAPLTLVLAACDKPAPHFAITDVHAVTTGKSAAAYFTIGNSGGPDRLVKVEAPGTGMAMLHDNDMSGGMARMRAAPDGFAIPAGEGLIMAPQGKHVMIVAKTAIEPDTRMPLVLHFEHHKPMALSVPVEAPGEEKGK